MMRMFEALPSYLGGKRKLVGAIFKHLPPATEAPVFADAFLGGGSVSLYAKARGYAVRCNDIAERSVVIGQSLVANDHARLCDADLATLFTAPPTDGFVASRFAPDIVTERHAAFLDGAMAVARGTPGTKGAMLRLLLVRYLLAQRPMGNFGAKTIVHQLAEGDFDAIAPHYLRPTVEQTVCAHPWKLVKDLAARINAGVFANGQAHEVHHGDALDFVRQVQADILYLDSPYGGTTSYEMALRPIDELLTGHALTPEPSRFSKADSLAFLEELFAAAAHVPLLAISYGGPAIDLDTLATALRRHRRHVTAEALRYAHLAGLAHEENRERNLELILIGRHA